MYFITFFLPFWHKYSSLWPPSVRSSSKMFILLTHMQPQPREALSSTALVLQYCANIATTIHTHMLDTHIPSYGTQHHSTLPQPISKLKHTSCYKIGTTKQHSQMKITKRLVRPEMIFFDNTIYDAHGHGQSMQLQTDGFRQSLLSVQFVTQIYLYGSKQYILAHVKSSNLSQVLFAYLLGRLAQTGTRNRTKGSSYQVRLF